MRGSKSALHLDMGASLASLPDREELPPLAALFLIYFDTKAGNTISWKRTSPGVILDGVEFKSLPSGLHNLKEDLVYFVHGEYAGVSAFINVAAAAEERNALMLSVGILVPLSYGRLGRSWRHAEGLKVLARQFATTPTEHMFFEEYYEKHKARDIPEVPESASEEAASNQPDAPRPGSYSLYGRTRSVSDAAIPVTPGPGHTLSPSHPALSLNDFIDLFGPLVFPLYRAALARKRILLLTDAPVEPACNFVYDISILSNIPLSVANFLNAEPSRLKPLFSIGVHEIPFLEDQTKLREDVDGDRGSWVACSTDDVLHMKSDLYDVVVTLPRGYSKNATQKAWPRLECPAGTPLKATQRDLRRYRALRRSLRRRYQHSDESPDEDDSSAATDDSTEEEPSGIEDICEKLSWREIAYSGFLWWASAGEKRSDEEADDSLPFDMHTRTPHRAAANEDHENFGEEGTNEGDEGVPGRLSTRTTMSTGSNTGTSTPYTATPHRRQSLRRRSTTLTSLGRQGLGSAELDIIAYFHRSTQRILSVVSHASQISHVDMSVDNDDEVTLLPTEGGDDEAIFVSLEDMDRMGLDRYSDIDMAFVKECGERWFGRKVEVERWRVNCCGIECG